MQTKSPFSKWPTIFLGFIQPILLLFRFLSIPSLFLKFRKSTGFFKQDQYKRKTVFSFLIYAVLLFPVSSSWGQDNLFNKYPVLNSKVESFIDHFIMALFSEEIRQYSIQFSDQSDFSNGFVEGHFNSQITALNTTKPESPVSNFSGNWTFYIDPYEGGHLEYGLNFRWQAQIYPIQSFLAVMADRLSHCSPEQGQNTRAFGHSFCETYRSYQWQERDSVVANISQILYLWKSHFIEQLEQIQDPDLTKVQKEFVAWIDRHIVIITAPDSVMLDIDFSNLKRAFSAKALPFLRKTKLIDLSLESLQLHFFEDALFIEAHIKKMHVGHRINLYVELLAQLQSFMEDSERGAKLGQTLREDFKRQEINELAVLKQLNLKEGALLGITLGSSIINANQNKEVIIPSTTEEDLGLE